MSISAKSLIWLAYAPYLLWVRHAFFDSTESIYFVSRIGSVSFSTSEIGARLDLTSNKSFGRIFLKEVKFYTIKINHESINSLQDSEKAMHSILGELIYWREYHHHYMFT